jgi:phosphoglycerate-specific signal transduction histidine kinase
LITVSIPILDGTKFSEWSEQVQFYLGLWDLDLALRTEKPPTITDSSSAKEKARYKFWERSNRLSIMFMRMNMVDNIKTTLSECDTAKELFKTMEEHFRSIDKSLTGTLMDELTAMKFDGTREIHEHILEMTNIATKLRALGMNVDELFPIQLILDSLPPQYGVQEETRLEQQGHYSVYPVSHKKIEPPEVNGYFQVIEVHEKRQNNVIEPPEINEHPQVLEVHERRQNNVICYFCNEIGHIKKNCHKRRAWFEKRGKFLACVCFESNLIEVLSSTW